MGVGALELIPGDPEELGRLAARLAVLGDGMGEAATKLADVDAAGWSGPAADAFQGLVAEQPAKYRTAGSAFGHAVGAIRAYAAVLRRAQADAGRAVSMFEDADRESEQRRRSRASYDSAVRSAQAAGDPSPSGPSPPASDPGGADRAASQSLLGDARSAVRAQGQIAASALSNAADDAPKEPGLLHSAIGGIGDLFGGVGDGLSAAWTATTAALTDAAGWVKGAFEQYGFSVLEIAAGALAIVVGVQLVAAGVAVAAVGVAADATGVGAVVGIPLNLGGVAMAGGGLILIVGGGALLMEGVSDFGDDVEEARSDGETKDPPPRSDNANDNLDETAESFIGRTRKGSINREFPSELKGKTLDEIKKGKTAAEKKAWKLLNDGRFKK